MPSALLVGMWALRAPKSASVQGVGITVLQPRGGRAPRGGRLRSLHPLLEACFQGFGLRSQTSGLRFPVSSFGPGIQEVAICATPS